MVTKQGIDVVHHIQQAFHLGGMPGVHDVHDPPAQLTHHFGHAVQIGGIFYVQFFWGGPVLVEDRRHGEVRFTELFQGILCIAREIQVRLIRQAFPQASASWLALARYS
jgi:hypothetical protein